MPERKILFVCTGNTCRSPMAAAMLRQMVRETGIESVTIESAGIAALPGMPATSEAREVLRRRGLDLSDHSSRAVTSELLEDATLVLTMTAGHRDRLLEQFDVPGLGEKTVVLGSLAQTADTSMVDPCCGVDSIDQGTVDRHDVDIGDPYGFGREAYERTADDLEAVLKLLMLKLTARSDDVTGEAKQLVIGIGSDHAGYDLKKAVIEFLTDGGHEARDMGTDSTDSVDYPDFAEKVARGVASGEFDRGILICGTGIGMSIAANKIPGVRAALCHDSFSAHATREHNDANVLTMGARVIGEGLALEIVRTWLGADFEGGRHARRVKKISGLEHSPESE